MPKSLLIVFVCVDAMVSINDVTIFIPCNIILIEFTATADVFAVVSAALLLISFLARVALVGVVVIFVLAFEFVKQFLFLRHEGVSGEFGSGEQHIIIGTETVISVIRRRKDGVPQVDRIKCFLLLVYL